jgi:hypothetical protein
MGSRNFRRRNHRRRHQSQEGTGAFTRAGSFPECPICKKPIRELPTALSYRDTGTPAHFDCVLKEIRGSLELSPQDRLCYLGGGTFGVLQFKSSGSGKFTIKKKIPYEDKTLPQEWKKILLVTG